MQWSLFNGSLNVYTFLTHSVLANSEAGCRFRSKSCSGSNPNNLTSLNMSQLLHVAGPAEPIQSLRPWSNQEFFNLWSKPGIFGVVVRPIIVRLRLLSDGRTNLALLPPPLCGYCGGALGLS